MSNFFELRIVLFDSNIIQYKALLTCNLLHLPYLLKQPEIISMVVVGVPIKKWLTLLGVYAMPFSFLFSMLCSLLLLKCRLRPTSQSMGIVYLSSRLVVLKGSCSPLKNELRELCRQYIVSTLAFDSKAK